jgi:hypothetical protein
VEFGVGFAASIPDCFIAIAAERCIITIDKHRAGLVAFNKLANRFVRHAVLDNQVRVNGMELGVEVAQRFQHELKRMVATIRLGADLTRINNKAGNNPPCSPQGGIKTGIVEYPKVSAEQKECGFHGSLSRGIQTHSVMPSVYQKAPKLSICRGVLYFIDQKCYTIQECNLGKLWRSLHNVPYMHIVKPARIVTKPLSTALNAGAVAEIL